MPSLRATLLASLLLAAGCGAEDAAKSPCEQHRDDVVERHLAGARTPSAGDDQLAVELDKHRAALTAAHGARLVRECQRLGGSR